jgi:hypothetical protein
MRAIATATTIATALIIVALATPAPAQMGGGIIQTDPDKPRKTDVDVAKEKATEKGYKDGLAKIPDQKPSSNDPWGGVRADPKADQKKSIATQKKP